MVKCSELVQTRLEVLRCAEIMDVVSKIMSKQGEELQLGVAAEGVVIREAWVRAAVGARIDCREDVGLMVTFTVSAATGIPLELHGKLLDAFERIHDLLTSVCAGGFRTLPEPEDFRRHKMPGFADLVLVTLAEEGLFAGKCCGEGCKLRELIGDNMIQTMSGLRDALSEDPLVAAAEFGGERAERLGGYGEELQREPDGLAVAAGDPLVELSDGSVLPASQAGDRPFVLASLHLSPAAGDYEPGEGERCKP